MNINNNPCGEILLESYKEESVPGAPYTPGTVVFKYAGEVRPSELNLFAMLATKVRGNLQDAYKTAFPDPTIVVVKIKGLPKYHRTSTHLLGYVLGTRVEGGQPFYQVRWDVISNGSKKHFTGPEYPEAVIAVSDIVILSPQDLINEII